MTYPKEFTWYLAKYIPDPMRAEPRNIGLIVVAPMKPMEFRFWKDPCFARNEIVHREWIKYWSNTIAKYDSKCLYWIAKRRSGDAHYIELAGAELVTGLDFGAMYARLVDPSDAGPGVDLELGSEKMPGWWKKK